LAEDKTVKLSMYLPEQLRLRFKLACTAKQVSMNQVLLDFVESWTDENDPMQAKTPASSTSAKGTGGKGRGKKGGNSND
jgi:hypothetical protein